MALLFFYTISIFRQVFHFLHDIIGSQHNKNANSCDRKEQKEMAITIIRQIDALGRIVIPKDLRNQYDIKNGDKIYFNACDDGILICSERCECNEELEDDTEKR